MRRRTFIGAGVTAAAGACGLSCARSSAGPYLRFFTADEAATVDAICEQLIPADQDAGARQARVVNYIDIQLARAFKKHRRAYREAIHAIDSAARARFGKRFVELSSPDQIEMLRGAEQNQKAFFDLILLHTRQGFYGDPRHGGNRDMASWKMLRLPFPPLRGRQHYDEPAVG